MKNFQIIVIGVFIFFIVAGVAVFAILGRGGGGPSEERGKATIWGTLPEKEFEDVVNRINSEGERLLDVSYREIREDEFDNRLVEALASGIGPDAILLPQDLILRHEDKVFVIPFDSFPERDFKNIFIEEGELYLTESGILGLPFSVDPLVMYWNRTLFSNKGIAKPPEYWDEFFALSEKLTEKDQRGNVLKSAVALGEFRNVANASEIISSLIMQAGSPIIVRKGDDVDVVLASRFDLPVSPAEASMRFYTEFSNPVKQVYSWNRSLPFSQDAFLAGDLAVYFGFASELFEIQGKNPNLNFDVAPLPQARDVDREVTFGKMHALALLKSSPTISDSFRAIFILSQSPAISAWSEMSGLPPVRRDVLSEPAGSAFRSVFNDSALISAAFLDPNKAESDKIFQKMVEDITSGRERISSAVGNADDDLELLIGQ